jgi:2-amino-4-hydroxy-6-hydroxymethyldihydropteridine diphosphokinase
MEVAALALGANLGDRLAALRAAVARLRDDGFTLHLSALYESAPWGDLEQPPYLNAVAAVEGDSGEDWLGRARALEAAAGRSREPVRRFGPRTLDVDVVEVWRRGLPLRNEGPELILPHPRAAERPFVLVPLAEVLPEHDLAGLGPIRDLAAQVPRQPGDLHLLAERW